MLQTPLCSLLGIRAPIIQGALGGPWPPSVGLAAAVSEAGALGSLPTALRSAEQVRDDIAALRRLTDRPFAVNHTMKPFLEDVSPRSCGPGLRWSPSHWGSRPSSSSSRRRGSCATRSSASGWGARPSSKRVRPELAERMRAAIREGSVHELMVITGEVAGAIDEVLPAAEIVSKLVTEAEEVLQALTAR